MQIIWKNCKLLRDPVLQRHHLTLLPDLVVSSALIRSLNLPCDCLDAQLMKSKRLSLTCGQAGTGALICRQSCDYWDKLEIMPRFKDQKIAKPQLLWTVTEYGMLKDYYWSRKAFTESHCVVWKANCYLFDWYRVITSHLHQEFWISLGDTDVQGQVYPGWPWAS